MTAWYRTGTVSVENASTTVTGSLTAWLMAAKVGDAFVGPDDARYEITAVTSNTEIEIYPAYAGSTASAQSYAIERISTAWNSVSELSVTIAETAEAFQRGFSMTSMTEVEIGDGPHEFSVPSGLPILPGARLLLSSAADPSTHWILGVVTGYAGQSLVVEAETWDGEGDTRSDWNINISGPAGPPGGLTSVVDDTDPALGGDLDANTHDLLMGEGSVCFGDDGDGGPTVRLQGTSGDRSLALTALHHVSETMEVDDAKSPLIGQDDLDSTGWAFKLLDLSDTVVPDGFDPDQNIYGYAIHHKVQAGAAGNRSAMFSQLSVLGAATGADQATFFSGGSSVVWAKDSMGGSAPTTADSKGSLFAGYDGVILDAAATNYFAAFGREIAVAVSGSVAHKAALALTDLGPADTVKGTETDCLLSLGSLTGAAKKNDGILVSSLHGQFPIEDTGFLLRSSKGAATFQVSALGRIDIPNATYVRWRNANNDAWLDAIQVTASDQLLCALPVIDVGSIPLIDSTYSLGSAANAYLSVHADNVCTDVIELTEISSPSNPAANKLRLFVKDEAGTTKVYTRDSTGAERELGTGKSIAMAMILG